MRVSQLAATLLLAPCFASAQQEVLKILPDALPNTTGYGVRLVVHDTIGLITANTLGPSSNRSGVDLVELSTGDSLGGLFATDGFPGDGFGASVEVHQYRAVIGSPDGTFNTPGAAYLYSINTALQLRKYTYPGGQPGDYFGSAVAYNGTHTIVGARQASESAVFAGRASVFEPTTGQFLRDLVPSSSGTGRLFGASLALAGDLVLVGAPGQFNTSGSAFLFDVNTGQQLFELKPANVPLGTQYGVEVGLAPPYAVVGSRINDGSITVFDITTGLELYTRNDPEDPTLGYFGQRLDVAGSRALVGHMGLDAIGTAYVIDLATGATEYQLLASDPDSSDFFGSGLSLVGNRAVVGAPGEGFRGAAYVFSLDGLSTSACLANPNSTGEPGQIFVSGSASLADQNLELRMLGAPEGQPGLFFSGLSTVQVPFGEGKLCIGGTLLRVGDPVFEQGGEFVQELDFSGAASGLVAGTTYFQTWFRDPAFGGTNFHLSDRAEVLLLP